jgi:hypothetical protein
MASLYSERYLLQNVDIFRYFLPNNIRLRLIQYEMISLILIIGVRIRKSSQYLEQANDTG